MFHTKYGILNTMAYEQYELYNCQRCKYAEMPKSNATFAAARLSNKKIPFKCTSPSYRGKKELIDPIRFETKKDYTCTEFQPST